MIWQAPRYDEIKMDAEIGSYQPDTDSPADRYTDSAAQGFPETHEAVVVA